jgi:sulfite reductase (NADPH) hemoprotein beta-component
MHGIQTSGNTIRNITSDERAGIAVDEIVDTRPFAEIIRQWSTLHPEFAFLPRKFKIAFNGAREDRAATGWHDIGLQLIAVKAIDGAPARARLQGAGRRRHGPHAGRSQHDPRVSALGQIMLNYIEAVVRVYNRYGRRDNKYKARIKILVKAEGQRFIDEVEAEYRQILRQDGAPHTIPQRRAGRACSASFVVPPSAHTGQERAHAKGLTDPVAASDSSSALAGAQRRTAPPGDLRPSRCRSSAPGWAPGDADGRARWRHWPIWPRRFSAGELRLTHDQNLILPWVRCAICRNSVRAPRPGPGFRPLQHPPADGHDRLPGR